MELGIAFTVNRPMSLASSNSLKFDAAFTIVDSWPYPNKEGDQAQKHQRKTPETTIIFDIIHINFLLLLIN